MTGFEMEMVEAATAASAGASADALLALGLQYSAGRGVAADLVEAHKWFNLAAMQGSAAARTYRMELAQEMSRTQIANAQRLAREWLSHH